MSEMTYIRPENKREKEALFNSGNQNEFDFVFTTEYSSHFN